MPKLKHLLCYLTASITSLIAALTLADTLELADGSLLEGDFVGSSNGIVMFNTGESIEAFPEAEVVGVYFTSGVETATKQQSKAQANVIVPSGTRLVIRTSSNIDSKKHKAGHRFRGQLESAIVIDGITVAPRGTVIHGKIVQASQGGRMVGSSDMAIEFTDIMLGEQLFEIATEDLKAQTGNEAGRTAGRTARSAVIGALIGGKSGAKTGAKVGVGASILTSGQSIFVPAGTIVETRLRLPLTVPG